MEGWNSENKQKRDQAGVSTSKFAPLLSFPLFHRSNIPAFPVLVYSVRFFPE
jgi:hypothetical protein